MRFHVVGLPHTSTTPAYSWCAYTQKVRHFCDMMTAKGHEVFLYAGPHNTATVKRHVRCTKRKLPSYIPDFVSTSPEFKDFNEKAIVAIQRKIQPRDFVCIIGGTAQQPIADAFPNNMAVEFGIGYGGVFSRYRVWESYAWMHTVLGALTGGDAHRADGAFFDEVIPNSFDPEDFPLGEGDGGYLLYMGRVIERKGIEIAVDAAGRAGLPLHVAGGGGAPPPIHTPQEIIYHSVVGPEERAKLMGGAVALLAPTLYVEPFGGVVAEAQLCGTPTITTDWGAFTETVQNGVNGYRCRMMQEFVSAIQAAPSLDRHAIRVAAQQRYALDVCAERYDAYFRRLETLWGDGFYASL